MEPSFASIEKDLSVTEIPAEDVNPNNDALRRGALALGWKGARAPAQPHRLPEERLLRARLRLRREAERAQGRRAAGARRGRRRSTRTSTCARDPRRARLGASASRRSHTTASAPRSDPWRASASARRSSSSRAARSAPRRWRAGAALPDPYARLGRGLRMHPGGVVAGRFDEADPRAPRHPAVVRVHRAALVRGGERSPRVDRPRVRAPDRDGGDAARLRRRAHALDARVRTPRGPHGDGPRRDVGRGRRRRRRRAGRALPHERARSRAAREGPRRVRAAPSRGRRARGDDPRASRRCA